MTVEFARRLRRQSTDAEAKLWSYLRNRNLVVKFRRQAPFGRYVADFLSEEAKLVVEIDGGQHRTRAAADERRNAIFDAQGYLVIRFGNDEVLTNIEGVISVIDDVLHTRKC